MFSKQLEKEAAKYKKWFESYSINPFSFPINDHTYHLVIYHGNNPQHFKGYAVISDNGGTKEEHRKALFPLTVFSAATANIFDFGSPRSKILPQYYEGVIQTIQSCDHSKHPTFIKAKELFEQLLELQRPFNDLFHEYDHYYNREVLVNKIFTNEDVEYTLSILSKLDQLQFRQGLLLEKYDDILPDFFDKIKQYKREFPQDSWNFIKGMKANRGILGKRMADFEFERSIMHLPEDEQIEKKKEDARKNAEKLIKERERLLRGPAAL